MCANKICAKHKEFLTISFFNEQKLFKIMKTKSDDRKWVKIEIQFSYIESQIYEYIDRHKFFDNCKEISFYF